MIDLACIVDEVGEWSIKNFGNQESWRPLLGIGEELGELNHAYLKRAQGTRGTYEEHTAAIKDSIADLIIFTCDFCYKENIDLEKEIKDTWAKVCQRNWKANPLSAYLEVK